MMEHLVQGTNDSSTLSKHSMVSKGYFKDDFIKYFINKPVRRSPLINIGYFVRAKIMQSSIMFYLDKFEHSSQNKSVQVVSLGAGFDTIYFNLASNNNNVTYFEIDYPEVVEYKIACIKRNEQLASKLLLPENIEPLGLKSEKYTIFGQDLNDLDGMEFNLVKLGLCFNLPTLIFSECAITYMDEIRSSDLIRWASSKFPNGIFLTYEQINPKDGFGIVMKKHFDKIQNPLKSVDKYTTVKQQEQRYLSCGWSRCKSIVAMDLYNKLLPLEEQIKVFKLEPFDEFEEWHLKCCHYAITVAYHKKEYEPLFLPHTDLDIGLLENLSWEYYFDGNLISRFAHCSLMINNHQVLIIGGFGSDGNQHRRTKNILCVDLTNKSHCHVKFHDDPVWWDSLHSSCSQIPHTNYFVWFGGRASPLKTVNESPLLISVCSKDDTVTLNTREIISDQKPCPRWRHSATFVYNNLIVIGGRTIDLKVLGDVWLMRLNVNSAKASWKKLSAENKYNTPSPRFSHSTTENDGKLYLTGGLGSNLRPLGDLWILQLKDESQNNIFWEKVNVQNLKPRYSHTSHVILNTLILVGGVNLAEQQPVITTVLLDTMLTREYVFPACDPEYPILLHNHSTVFSDEEKCLFIIGGGGNCFSFGTSFNRHILKIPVGQLIKS